MAFRQREWDRQRHRGQRECDVLGGSEQDRVARKRSSQWVSEGWG